MRVERIYRCTPLTRTIGHLRGQRPRERVELVLRHYLQSNNHITLTLRTVDSLRTKGVELQGVSQVSQPVVVTEGRLILLNRIEGP